MRFIGFHGPAGVGKGTAAQIACEKLACRGYMPVRRSFGDVIRAVAGAMANRIPDEYLDVEVKKAESPFRPDGQRVWSVTPVAAAAFSTRYANLTNREFLQRVGAMIRAYFQFGVLTATVLRLPAEGEDDVVVVFDDVRMSEESCFIRERGGIVVRIVGPDRTGTMTDRAMADRTAAELPLEEVDCTIENLGSIDDLRKQVEAVIRGAVIFGEFGEEARA